LRPWLIGAGIGLHLGIEYSIRIGFFSIIAIAGLWAFLAPETSERAILRLRRTSG
jgi:hypothetical protein